MPRVMLERPDYFQKLVNLGCKLDRLGTVTWNPATHSVDVSGSVYLYSTGLTRLPFQFGKVGGSFWCHHNRLTNLDGAPKEVGGDFVCSADDLTDVSALRGCKIKSGIYLFGPEADKARVMELLRAQGFKGDIYLTN